MKTVASSVIALITIVLMAGCQGSTFEKTKSNLVYKIYRSKDTAAVQSGGAIKVQVIQKINDSTMFDTHSTGPVYIPVKQTRPYDASEVFTKLRLNDSLVTIQMMDTFIKQNPRLLQNFKNGDRVITTFKVLHIYKNGESYEADQAKDQEGQRVKDEAQAKTDLEEQAKTLEKYFADKHITVQKTPLGAYVASTDLGTGAQVDSGKYVTVKYNGKHFDTDSSFQASTFVTQIQGARPAVKGFEDGLKAFKSGGKGTIYIPGALGYGRNPQPGSPFKPNEILKFEVEIENVSDQAPEQQARPLVNSPRNKIDTVQRKK